MHKQISLILAAWYILDYIVWLIPQSLQLQAQVILRTCADVTSRKSARSRVCVEQCVSAVRDVEVPVLVSLRNTCNHVTEVGGS